MVLEEGVEMAAPANVLLHSIGDAAKLAGVSRSLLRLWEKEGLVNPKRTAGGHRLYSTDDVQRLRKIAHLRRVDRLNLVAIRRELGADGSSGPPTSSANVGGMGQRLRALRTSRGLSLAAVAQQSGLSISFLSAVERGQSNMSVANLFKLADAYGTTVPALGSDHPAEQRSVLHPEDRPRYAAGGGHVLIEDLVASPGALEAQHIEILPGGSSEEAYAHPGEEFIYILSGSLSFRIDEREHYSLEPGDTLYFQSTQLHRWWNEGDVPVNLIWINVPLVDQSGTGLERQSAARRPRETVRHGSKTRSGDRKRAAKVGARR